MNFERRSPCVSCPYRKDARLGFWDASHFTKLLQDEVDPLFGSMYLCHEDGKKAPPARGFCIGWLLLEQANGVPSIQLRLKLMADEQAREQFKALRPDGLELYGSVRQMCMDNLRAIGAPKRTTKKKKAKVSK
jgi:hypothetical protein